MCAIYTCAKGRKRYCLPGLILMQSRVQVLTLITYSEIAAVLNYFTFAIVRSNEEVFLENAMNNNT